MFTKGFNKLVYDGERITCGADGFQITATAHHDPDMGPPWREHDGHGIVTEWTTRRKMPGERILARDGGHYRYYDIEASIRTARADNWDAEPYNTGTVGERAARAVEHDFRMMKAWCDDEWAWCGIAVTVARNGIQLTGDYAHVAWGIACNYPGSDNAYLLDVANELLDDALDAAKARLAALCVVCDADADEANRCL